MCGMSMDKKLFAVADIHGHFTELKKALDASGFENGNPEHLLIVCGDLFDRGSENRAVLAYLSETKNKILIRGNHDDRLAEILESRHLEYYDAHNHTDETIEEFFGVGCVDGNLNLKITDESLFRKLVDLYRSELDYYECGNYIFTHGWLPSEVIERTPYLLRDWRSADADAWKNARWLQWQQMYARRDTATIPGKTIVCGHRPSSLGYMFDHSRTFDDHSIFYGDGMIAIDGGTVRSGIVNVLVIEPEENCRR